MANERRLIDGNALLVEVVKAQALEPNTAVAKIIMLVTEAESVDAVEVVHGRWEDVSLRFTQVKEKCTVCGGIVYAHGFNYCHHCGAKMDGERKDNG